MSRVHPATTHDVLGLLDGAATSAAIGAAMELGLFWLLDASPLDAPGVAAALGIAPLRCGYWLQLLAQAGLLERDEDGRFRTGDVGRRAITGAYSQATWALLAQEARERFQAVHDLPRRLTAADQPDAATTAFSDTYSRMGEDAAAARRFTRMLYELHRPLAQRVAAMLDLEGTERLMDLGGGSGVVSLELARRHPTLSATVVDLATVCAAGAELAAAEGLAGRVAYHPADFLRDPLPAGFDVVLECDVNVYSAELLGKIRAALSPGGRYLIVDEFAAAPGEATPSRVHWAFARSMLNPAYVPPSLPWIRALLASNGFRLVDERPLAPPSAAGATFTGGMTVIDARP